MTNHQIARLACRILSLYAVVLLLDRMDWLAATIAALCYPHSLDPTTARIMLYSILITLLPFVLLLIAAAMLWFKADFFASRMTAKESTTTTSMSAATAQTIAFAGVGVYFLVVGLMGLITLVAAAFQPVRLPYWRWHWWSVVSVVLGLALLLGARPFSTLVTWLRTAGVPRDDA